MIEVIQSTIKMLGWYIGDSWQYFVFIAALLYILADRREEETRRLFVGYTLIFSFIYFCPVTAKIIMIYCTGELVYWRMFWILPIPIILAYVCTKIWSRQKHKAVRVLSLFCMAAVILFSGRFVYGEGTPFQKAGNLLKLPPEVCWVSDILNENAAEDEKIKVAAPTELVGYIRQYDAKIELAFGRSGNRGRRRRRLEKEMLAESPDFKVVAKCARRLKCNFLIYPSDEWQDETIRALGFEPVGNVNTYTIYKDKNSA